MTNKYNSNIFHWDEDIVNSLKDARFSDAASKQIKEEEDCIDFFKKSGFEAIWTLIRKSELYEDIDSLFVTFTTLISSLENQKLSDLVICHCKQDNKFIDNVKLYYKPLYKYLYDEKLGVFYKNQFFNNPSNSFFYSSESDHLLFDDVRNQKKIDKELNSIIEENNTVNESFLDINGNKLYPEKIRKNEQHFFSLANCSFDLDYFRFIVDLQREADSESINQYHNLLHYCYNKLFHNERKDSNSKTYLISIPLIGAKAGKDIINFQGQGACFLFFEYKKTKINFEALSNLTRDISYLIKDITYNYLFESGINLYESVAKKSIDSAIGAIMARNISHNIGSHVISSLVNNETSTDSTDLSFFHKYIQQRMDYIALITTSWPQWSYSCWFIKDLMRKFYSQRILLKYIASSESLGEFVYQESGKSFTNNQANKIKIRIVDKTFEDIILNDKDDIINQNDVQISIPGGTIGFQAFYTILENIIRNGAKHAWGKKQKTGQNYEILIQIINEEEKDFVVLRILDKCSDKDDLITSINQRINESFIGNLKDLKKGNWGIAEIKISCGYLNKAKPETVAYHSVFDEKHPNERNPEKQLNLNNFDRDSGEGLVTFDKFENESDGQYYYGYEFSIRKPKEVLVLTNLDDKFNPENVANAKQYNIYISNELKLTDFEFIILNDITYRNIIEGKLNIESFPIKLFYRKKIEEKFKRRIAKIEQDFASLFLNKEFNNFKLNLYKVWIDNIVVNRGENNNNFKILIDTASGESSKDKSKSKYEEYIETLPLDYTANSMNCLQHTNNTLEFILPNNCQIVKEQKGLIGENNRHIVLQRHYLFSPCFYAEYLSGAQSYFGMLSSIFNSNESFYNSNKFLLNIIETSFLRILIIDERAARFLNERKYTNEMLKRLNSAGITIQTNEFKIKTRTSALYYNILQDSIHDAQTTKDQNQEEDFLLEDETHIDLLELPAEEDTKIEYDILIIHQGILDKWFDKDVEEMKHFISNVKKKINNIVITSGRGETSEVLKSEKYLSFSDLSEYILKDYHEKILIVNLINRIISEKRNDDE